MLNRKHAAQGLGLLLVFTWLATATSTADAKALRNVSADCNTPACDPCAPKITYRYHGCQKFCCGCDTPLETILQVKEPCGCAVVNVPVCLPPCCLDVAKVSCDSGLFGRPVVYYEYPCGLTIKIIFRHRGDLVVTYLGK